MAKKEKKSDSAEEQSGASKVQRFRLRQDSLCSKYGSGTSVMASVIPDTLRISTGSFRLDYASGGGVPVGRTSLIWGGESSGKTGMVLRIGAQAQKLCANCYRMPVLASLLKMDDDTIVLGVPDGNGGFIDSETGREVVVASVAGELSKIQYCDCYSKALFVPKPLPGNGDNEFEKDAIFQARLEGYSTNSYEDVTVHYVNIEGDLDVGWARKIGIDTSRMAVTVCETGEEAVDVVKFLIDSCDNDVIIVDSLAMMVPMTEVEESAHDAHMGLQSRMLNQAMRVWTQARVAAKRKHGRDITILLVNQWRMKIDRFGGGPQLVGGLGQRFVGSFQVKCWSKKGESSQIDVGKKGYEVDVAETATTCFKVEKNKTFGSKEVEGEIEFFVRDCEEGKAGEVREFDYIWTLAKYFGIVFKQEKPIKWIMNGKVFDTETAAKAAVRTDPEVMAGLRSTLMTLLLGQIKKEMLGGKR